MSARPTRRAGWRTIAVTATTAPPSAQPAPPPGRATAGNRSARTSSTRAAEAQIGGGTADQGEPDAGRAQARQQSRRRPAARRRPGSAPGAARIPATADPPSAGVLVDIQGRVTDALVTRLRSVRATVVHASPGGGRGACVRAGGQHTDRGWLGGGHLRPAGGPRPSRDRSGPAPPPPPRAAAVGSALRTAPAARSQGSVVSEGDKAHGADLARRNQRVSGVGQGLRPVRRRRLLTTSQASGDLPVVDVLPGQEGEATRGTAMLEIIHDLAPTRSSASPAFNGAGAFADNIRAPRLAGCTVIVDDVPIRASRRSRTPRSPRR